MITLARSDEEADSGPRERRATERLCAATREVRPVEELIRFVLAPDGTVVPDLKRKLPGRGVWVTARRDAVAEAARRNVFSRAFKAKVVVPADLAALTERQLEMACLDALSMAHKAGRVATGFAKVEAALARGQAVALISAADSSADGTRKLMAAARRSQDHEGGPPLPIIRAFSSAQLDLALGRSNVVHAALLAGPASEGFISRCSRLGRFRTAGTGSCA